METYLSCAYQGPGRPRKRLRYFVLRTVPTYSKAGRSTAAIGPSIEAIGRGHIDDRRAASCAQVCIYLPGTQRYRCTCARGFADTPCILPRKIKHETTNPGLTSHFFRPGPPQCSRLHSADTKLPGYLLDLMSVPRNPHPGRQLAASRRALSLLHHLKLHFYIAIAIAIASLLPRNTGFERSVQKPPQWCPRQAPSSSSSLSYSS